MHGSTLAAPPHRSAALARIAQVKPAAYERTRNHLEGAVTGLSPYLTHGVLTMPEVLRALLDQQPLAVGHKLVFELGWREFFRHVWAHTGDDILHDLHHGPLPAAEYATVLPEDIRQACTGVPVIDQAVRTLYATGTLHNHARMWLASYVVHIRRVHWRAGADWLVAHLFDGDVASNHLSWQWVAGTGSHKPYLFNAENVARYAPPSWHSPGSVVDVSYDTLDTLARSARAKPWPPRAAHASCSECLAEPLCHSSPPPSVALHTPDAAASASVQGQDVWLVHPWALRAPPPDCSPHTRVIGVYLREHHTVWPWSQARWEWVDAAMADVTSERWWLDVDTLAAVLKGAASVRSVQDPHVSHWLAPVAKLDEAPLLFAPVHRTCTSFSQWWTRTTRGIQDAAELLS